MIALYWDLGRKSSATSEGGESTDDDDESSENPDNAEKSESSDKETKPVFKFLIVTGHADSSIKIWNENVNLDSEFQNPKSIDLYHILFHPNL